MKKILLIILLFASQSLLADDVTRCNFTFHGVDKNGKISKQPYLTHKHVTVTAKTWHRPTRKERVVVKFTEEGAAINKKYTSKNIGKYAAIYCDGKLLSKARILEVIEDELAFNLK